MLESIKNLLKMQEEVDVLKSKLDALASVIVLLLVSEPDVQDVTFTQVIELLITMEPRLCEKVVPVNVMVLPFVNVPSEFIVHVPVPTVIVPSLVRLYTLLL